MRKFLCVSVLLLTLTGTASAQRLFGRFFGGYAGGSCANGQCGASAMQSFQSVGSCANGQCGSAAMSYLPADQYYAAQPGYAVDQYGQPVYQPVVREVVTIAPTWGVSPTRRIRVRWGW